MRKKHGEAMAELTDQLDVQMKLKQKTDREKHQLQSENNELTKLADKFCNDKANAEKNCKQTQAHLQETQVRLDQAIRHNNELEQLKTKLSAEGNDLHRHLEETESQLALANKMRVSLQTQLDDMKVLADGESKERSILSSKCKNMQQENCTLKDQLEEESETRADIQRQLTKAHGDAALWRAKYESEAVLKLDELEGHKMKLQTRLSEAEDTVEGLNARCTSLEK